MINLNEKKIYDFSPNDDNDIYLNGYLRPRFAKMHPEVKTTALPQRRKPDGIYLTTVANGEVGPFRKVSNFLLGFALVEPIDYPDMCIIDLDGDIVLDPARIQTKDDLNFLFENATISMEKYGLLKTIQNNIPSLTAVEYNTAMKNALMQLSKPNDSKSTEMER